MGTSQPLPVYVLEIVIYQNCDIFFLNHVFQPATEKYSTKNIKKAKHFNYVPNFGEIIVHHLFTKNL